VWLWVKNVNPTLILLMMEIAVRIIAEGGFVALGRAIGLVVLVVSVQVSVEPQPGSDER